jgi:hypothetical protein
MRSRWLIAAITPTLLIGAAFADENRQAEVAARGAQVMPFKLSATTHIFTKTPRGGIQKVVAKDPKDTAQLAMIRTHLTEIAQAFQRGDFSGPTQTHGAQMPGLAKLKTANPGELSIRYRELANGAQIEYSSRIPELILAIHDWFDAQLADHGPDAMAGHDHMEHHP